MSAVLRLSPHSTKVVSRGSRIVPLTYRMFDTSYPYGHGGGTIETETQTSPRRASVIPSRSASSKLNTDPYPNGRWTTTPSPTPFPPHSDSAVLFGDEFARWLAR